MNKKERGFTMVELMLAMALVAFIFLFTLTVLTQLLTTYNKGLALTQINQAIRQLDNDIGKGLRFSSPGAFNSKYYDTSGNVVVSPNEVAAGVFCTGTIAYVWNIGENVVFTYAGTTNEAVRLVRVVGAGADGAYCTQNTKKIPKGNDNVTVGGGLVITSEDTTNLLGSQAMVLRAIVNGGTHVGKTFWFNGSMITCGEGGAVYTGTTITVPNINPSVCSGAGRLVKVQFALSTAGEFRASIEGEGTADERITCENTAHAGQYCSFGEFNSVVYLRGK